MSYIMKRRLVIILLSLVNIINFTGCIKFSYEIAPNGSYCVGEYLTENTVGKINYLTIKLKSYICNVFIL